MLSRKCVSLHVLTFKTLRIDYKVHCELNSFINCYIFVNER